MSEEMQGLFSLGQILAGVDEEQHARKPVECVFGPHLPGWPLVTYQGSWLDHHGPAVVREAYSWMNSLGEMEFRLTLETDNPIWESVGQRVLERVRLSSIAPLGPTK